MKMPNKIVPCIWCNGEAQDAAAFYTRTFLGGRVASTSHYPRSSDNPGGQPRGGVLTVEFEIFGQRFTALNGGPDFKPNPTLSFFVHCDDAAHVDQLFTTLRAGGKVLMALDSYPWSQRYGWVQDRFGVSWQVMVRGAASDEARIAPCFMFTGKQRGRAEEAMRFWTSALDGGRIDGIERYAKGEGPENGVVHGRFSVLGHRMVAMDSHANDPELAFGEGLSLQVLCKDQPEIDATWKRLSDGGQEVECGWLKDRFGFPWQVAPENMAQLLTAGDEASRDRVFAAMLKMKKLDKGALESAAQGQQARAAGRPGGGTAHRAP